MRSSDAIKLKLIASLHELALLCVVMCIIQSSVQSWTGTSPPPPSPPSPLPNSPSPMLNVTGSRQSPLTCVLWQASSRAVGDEAADETKHGKGEVSTLGLNRRGTTFTPSSQRPAPCGKGWCGAGMTALQCRNSQCKAVRVNILRAMRPCPFFSSGMVRGSGQV